MNSKQPIPLDTDFDASLANALARLESYNKHHYRPNSYLHKWWARRCGSTFRLILKQLAENEADRDYYAPGGLAGKIILDPMMGGGTTLHEAIRLGANVIGADLDPIPVLQARATLTHIPLIELEQAYKQFERALRAELDPYFLTSCPVCATAVPLRFVLYGLRRQCACGPVLVVDSLVVRQEANGSVIHLCPERHDILRDGRVVSAASTVDPLPLVEKGDQSCAVCNGRYADDLSRPFYARYQPLVIVGRCRSKQCDQTLFFKAPDQADRDVWQQAEDARLTLPFDPVNFVIEPGRKSVHLQRRGVAHYLDLYSSRQLLYLEAARRHLQTFTGAVQLNLALLVSTSLEFNAMLCGYKGKGKRRAGAIRHVFAHHAYAFPYTAVENNPLYYRQSSGTLAKLFHARIRRGREWAQAPRERVIPPPSSVLRPPSANRFVEIKGELDVGQEVGSAAELAEGSRRFLLLQGSSTELALADNSVDFIVTDPPYFDSVQYSDLAAFFRVWLRQLLPEAADWGYDVADSAVDPHKNDKESRYAELLAGIFEECARVLVLGENGRFIFTFHHWNPKAWAALTYALRQANFVLLTYYVVHAENPISVHINNMKALLHDAILVLAPAADWYSMTGSGLSVTSNVAEQPLRDQYTVGSGQGRVLRERSGEAPPPVDQTESEAFCRDCAAHLGWLLDQAELTRADIQAHWGTMLQ
jgi:putative DNA methylase